MIEYRAFCNTDPPHLVAIWQQHAARGNLLQPITTATLESQVFAKPFFEREGLIVAVRDKRPIAFVHAGFGPREDGSRLDLSRGLICLLKVVPGETRDAVCHELVARAEQYMRRRGACVFQGGAACPNAPYYHGLYGGLLVPGVLVGDHVVLDALWSAGYVETERRAIFRCAATEAHAVVDRQTMQVRRSCRVHVMIDPPNESWWEACTDAWHQRFRFTARARRDGADLAHITFRAVPMSTEQGGGLGIGLSQLRVFDEAQRDGLTLFLLGEAIRQLRAEGVQWVEAHAGDAHNASVELLEQLHFQHVDDGLIFEKQIA